MSNSIFRAAGLSLMALLSAVFGHAQTPFSVETIVINSHSPRTKISPKASKQPIMLTGMRVGETYQIIVSANPPYDPGCVPVISTHQIENSASVNTGMAFAATAKEMGLILQFPCSWPEDLPPQYTISIACASCKSTKSNGTPDAVLSVVEMDPESVVEEVLVGGDCFDANNIFFCGGFNALGKFSGGLTNLGFENGMILTTGSIDLAPGPNNLDDAGSTVGSCDPDPDLATLTTGTQFDVATLEFDFRPTVSQVTFEYVFASEEYCEAVGSQFNDVFGIFISGPGIPGGLRNLAVIPGTNVPISINSVNHINASGLYVNNQPASSGDLCGQLPAAGPAKNEIQYDGLTRKFSAQILLQPCQTYHIKFAIADVGDDGSDSGLFVREGSFDAGGNASVQWIVNGEPGYEAIEGCGQAGLLFTRVGGNPNQPQNVSFAIGGTATSGVDYFPIPNSIVIPAGETQYFFPVPIAADQIFEGTETVSITLNDVCSCSAPTAILFIRDLEPLVTAPDTVIVCGGGFATLQATVTGGVPDYTYVWQGGISNEASAVYFVTSSGNYRVTITDQCGQAKVQNFFVKVKELPKAQLLPPAPQICDVGGTATLKVNFTGTGPFKLIYTLNGVAQPAIGGITANPFLLQVSQVGLYQITSVTDSDGCVGTGDGSQLVSYSQLAVTGTVSDVQCSGQAGAITTTVTGGTGPYAYQWAGPQTVPPESNPINLGAGTYAVTVTDSLGCTRTAAFSVQTESVLIAALTQAGTPNCTNPNGGALNLAVTGSNPPYTFKWSNNATTQNIAGVPAGTYTVTITDGPGGCLSTASATIVGDQMLPIAAGVASNEIDCQTLSTALYGQGSSVGNQISYAWTAANGNGITGPTNNINTTANLLGNYVLVVTNNGNGCTASVTVPVIGNSTPPVASAGLPQTLTCAIQNITLDGSGSSFSANNISYAWTASNGGVIAGGSNTTQPIVSAVGTYTILVTNLINHCTATASVTVGLNNDAPTVTGNPSPIINCTNKQVTLSVNVSPSNVLYDWSTLTGNIISGHASPNPVVSEEGLYTVVVYNASNGCSATAAIDVDKDQSLPQINVASNQDLDCTYLTTVINAVNIGNSTNPVWTTTNGNIVSGLGTFNITVNQPGVYTLTVTNPTSQCTASESKLINLDNTPPPVVVGAPAILNCYNSNQITLGDPNAIPFNTTFLWTASNGGVVNPPANQSTITVSNPGMYKLRVTNTFNGCTNEASVTVGQDNAPPVAAIAPAGQIDCDNSYVQLFGTGSNGPSYNYLWTTSNGLIQVGPTTLTPIVTAAGTYQLLVTNGANGCTSTASVVVTSDLNLPNVQINPANPFTCNTQQVQLDADILSAGTFNIQWGSANGTLLNGWQTLNPNVGSPGTYTIIVTNTSSNCSAAQSVVVAANNVPPSISAGTTQTLNCTQPALTLSGNAPLTGHTYIWSASSGGNILSGANTLTPLINQPGIYTLEVTNTANGCSSTASVQVLQDAGQPFAAVAAPNALTCSTQQLTLNATASSAGPNYSYVWSGPSIVTGGNTQTPTVDAPGNYSFIITNNTNGCTATTTVTVTENIVLPIADAGPAKTLDCKTPIVQIGGPGMSAGPNILYGWSGPGIIVGGNTRQPTVNQSGTYVVTVTNAANGCTQTASVTLNDNFATPVVDAGPNGLLTCVDNFFEAAPTISGSGPLSYKWQTTGGSILEGDTTQTPLFNGAGTYYLIVTNLVSGCTATDLLQVLKSAEIPNADAVATDVLTCTVEQIALDGTGSSQNGPFVYLWFPISGGNIVSGANTLEPIVDEPGIYRLEVRDTSNSCIAYAQVAIEENLEQPNVDAGPTGTLTCSVNSLNLQGTILSNGNFISAWTASNGGNIVAGSGTTTPNVNASGTYTLLVTNTLNGCTASDQTTVGQDETLPQISISTPDTLDCVVKEIVLATAGSSTSNVAYYWSTPNGNFASLSDSSMVVVDKPGVYQLLIQNVANNCVSVASVTVAQNIAAPLAVAGASQEIDCNTIIATLSGAGSSTNGSFFYQWDSPNGIILSGKFSLTPTVASAGTYILTVLNNINGCKSTDIAEVTQDTTKPDITIVIPGLITCFSPEVVLDASSSSNGNNYEYSWTTPDGNILGGATELQAVVNAPGSYVFTILNAQNGCFNTDTTAVVENTVPPSVLILPPATITCSDPVVSITAIAENGAQFSFGWSTNDGNIVGGETTLKVRVDEPGTYNVLVVNNSNGCATVKKIDVIEITERPDSLEYSLDAPGCKDNDGYIRFDTVWGGIGPYLYSINGGNSFTTSVAFGSLAPGFYELLVQDVNGCEYLQEIEVPKDIDPGVDLIPELQLEFGDVDTLKANLPPGFPLDLIDTVIWSPTLYLDFGTNTLEERLAPICKPFNSIIYTVSIITKNGGCEAQDRIKVLVDGELHIYIPNVFTPDNPNDGNDVFLIFAEDTRKQIKQVNTFQIFDRWGEMVHQAANFQPNDPAYGWKGYLGSNGEKLTPAVFTYYAIIELVDGKKLLYEGDVTLVR
jgi:hypothetical protein